MNLVTQEAAKTEHTSALSQAEFEFTATAQPRPGVQYFRWGVGLVALVALGLILLLDNTSLNLLTQLDVSDLFVFFTLTATAIVCRYFFYTISNNFNVTLTTLLGMAAFLIFPPLPAALIGAIPSLWFEFFILKRGATFAIRTAGVFTLCGIGGRLTYELLGGRPIVGDIDLPTLGSALGGFLAYRLIHELLLTAMQYFDGFNYRRLLKQRFLSVNLIYLAMLPGALLLALLKFQVGPVSVLLACACVVMVGVILKYSSTFTSQSNVQLKQVQELNLRLAYQNQRQKALGASINQTLDSFLALVHEYAGTSHEQEAAVVEITATIEQLSRTATQIAGAADNVASAAEKAILTAEQGQSSVNSTIDAINEAQDKVREIAAKILDLTTKSERIGEIVTTINAIAGHIRMLALNATIEASGAGPFGRRFAVVASEVNQLADNSRQAVQQIREIIAEIQQATNSSVRVTEEGLQRMERSVAMATLSEQANQEIIGVVQKTAQAAAAISLATQQQRSASEQVVTSVHDVAVMIGRNTEKIGSVSGASLELQRIARELQSENF